jgi:hypothetical protein
MNASALPARAMVSFCGWAVAGVSPHATATSTIAADRVIRATVTSLLPAHHVVRLDLVIYPRTMRFARLIWQTDGAAA